MAEETPTPADLRGGDITSREEAEDALRASEERYRAFIANSSEGIWRFELEAPVPVGLPADEQISRFYERGYLAECNDAMARMYGYGRAEEIEGARLGDLLVRDDPKNVEYLRAFVSSGYRLTDIGSVELDREGRQRFFANNLIGVVADGLLLRAWGTQRDVTERERIKEALRATEHRFSMFMEHLPGLAWIKDLGGRYVYVNEAAARAFGAPPEELCGKTDEEVFPPETAAEFRKNDGLALASGAGLLTFEALEHDDGLHHSIVSKFPIPGPEGEAAMVGGIAIDITERRRAEAERERLHERERAAHAAAERRLRESVKLSEVYRDLARSLEQADVTSTICRAARELVGADGASFIIREGPEVFYADEDALGPLWKGRRFPASACVSGWSIAERQPAVIEDIYADRRVPTEAYRPTFVKSLLMVPVRAVSPVGAIGAYWAARHRASDDELRLMQALAHAADLAFANSQLFEQMKRARLEAEHASRLKDEFLATLSHELRTPLTAVTGWAHMLASGSLDAETARHAVEVIRRNAEQQRQIVEEVLDASRIVTGKLRVETGPAELLPAVEAACDAVRPAAQAKGVELRCDYDPRVGQLTCDPARLQQVFWNLLSNAVKFTPPGGQVRVEVQRLLTHVRVEVSDTGSGIPADFLPFVFDRFRQADGSTTRQHGGLGLGLSIVRHLVELHGGSVHAYSAGEGQGATFTVDLPLPVEAGQLTPRAADGEARGAHESAGPPARAGGPRPEPLPRLLGVRVLLVDDDEDTLEMLSMFLRRGGAEVTAVASAGAALGALGRVNPDVIVADIGMPEANGYELLRRVRSLGAGRGGLTPAIALTAYAREEDRARALRSGFQRHLAKPADPGELLAIIADLAGKAGAL